MANWTANSNADDNVYISFGGNQSSPDPGDFKFFHEALAGVSKFNVISTLRSSGVDDKPVFFETQEFRLQALKTTMVSGNITPGTGDKGLIWEYSGVGNSKIELYANDSVKLTTKSDGVLISGELQSTTLDVNGTANISGNTTIGSSAATSISLNLIATNTAGAPAQAVAINLAGYENRGSGTFHTDSSNVGEEWYSGVNYNGGFTWQVGYDSSGGQAEYVANSKLRVYQSGQLQFTDYGQSTFSGTVTTFPAFAGDGLIVDRTPAQVRGDIGAGTGNGTVLSVSQTHGGNAFTVGGSPVTSTGTLAITMAGSSSQLVNGAGDLATIPTSANNATITIAGADGIRINSGGTGDFTTNQSVNETITVTMDYAGVDNFILGSANAAGTAIQSTDKIIYSDVSTNDINFGNVSDLPFDNSGGTMSSWVLDADSGGTNTISNGETVDIAGGTNITTTLSSNTVTITNDVVNNNQLVNGAGYTTNTGTVTGTGVSGRVAFWNGGSSITSDPGFTFNNGSDALTIGGIMNWSGGNSTEANSAYDNMITAFTDSGTSTITLTLTQQDGGTLTTSFANPLGTVTEVGISHTGNAFSVGGTPINSSGTLGIDMQGTSSQYINGAGNLINLSTLAANNPTITLTAGTGLTGGGSFTLNQSGASTITFNNSITNNNQLTNGAGYVTTSGVTSVATGDGLTGGTISATGTVSVDYGSSGLINDAPGGTGSISENDFILIGKDESGSGETRSYEVQELASVLGSGTVTSVGAANPATGGAVGSPLFISGTPSVSPIVNFVQANIQATNVSTAVDGGVTKGTWNSNTQLDKTGSTHTAASYQGEVVYFGSAGTLAQGKLYVYQGGDWVASDADFIAKSQGLIAIALGTSLSAGMLTRGMYTLPYNPALADGDILYLSPTEGQMYYEPPSGSQDVVRILATALSSSTGEIFFHPDNTFIELT